MNVLAIGNSFSQDATRYLHAVARADGVSLDVANLYIGGCPLERHFRNMHSGERAYELQYNGSETNFFVSLKEALLNRQWDVITIQQASHLSFDPASYTPYAARIAACIRELAPKARLMLHQTWAYEDGSERLRNVAGYDTAAHMLADIKTAYASVCAEISADGLIPSGELLAGILAGGVPKIHRDTFHASLGLGRYALALLWYHTLTGRPVTGNTFDDLDEPAPSEQMRFVREYVDSF